MVEGVDPLGHAIGIGVNAKFEPVLLCHPVTEADHLGKFPGGIDVEQWNGIENG